MYSSIAWDSDSKFLTKTQNKASKNQKLSYTHPKLRYKVNFPIPKWRKLMRKIRTNQSWISPGQTLNSIAMYLTLRKYGMICALKRLGSPIPLTFVVVAHIATILWRLCSYPASCLSEYSLGPIDILASQSLLHLHTALSRISSRNSDTATYFLISWTLEISVKTFVTLQILCYLCLKNQHDEGSAKA